MALLRFYRMIAIFLWEMLRLHPSSTPIFLHPDVATATSYFHFTPIPLFSASALLCFSSSSFSSIFFFSSSQRRHTHPLTGEETSTAPRNLRLCLRHSLSLSLSLSLSPAVQISSSSHQYNQAKCYTRPKQKTQHLYAKPAETGDTGKRHIHAARSPSNRTHQKPIQT